MYVNGTQETAFATLTYPSQNTDHYKSNATQHWIRRSDGASNYFMVTYV
jgi:hypothetical protein